MVEDLQAFDGPEELRKVNSTGHDCAANVFLSGDGREACESFLRALWPEESLPGWLVVFTLPGRECTWCSTIDEAVGVAIQNRQQRSIYFGVALQDQDAALAKARERRAQISLSRVRGFNGSTVALPGFWADLDIKAPGHSEPNLPPDLEAALSLLEAVPCKPTVVVDSGYGIHTYWLFREPWIFESEDDRQRAAAMLRRLQTALRTEGATHGWSVEAPADLARVLRLPGTFNHKGDAMKAVAVRHSEPGQRYDPDEIVDHLPDMALEAMHSPAASESTPPRSARTTEGPPADIDLIRNGCAWLNHSYEDRATLSEPEWYAALSIVGRCRGPGADGRQLAHAWSEGYPGYSREETDRKLDHALSSAGPRTCKQIGATLGASQPYCSRCQHQGKIASPIVLGRLRDSRASGRAVVLVGNDEKRMNDEALKELAHHSGIYRRSGLLVQVIPEDRTSRLIVRPPGAPRIAPIQEATLREMLSEVVDFRKPTQRKSGTRAARPVNPPQQCCRALLLRGRWPRVRILEGVTETPFLRPDGSVSQEPGYDQTTGILFVPNTSYHQVASDPNRIQVRQALEDLREAVCDFPFQSEEHYAAWIASLLTPLARHAFTGPVPLILVDANTPGTGKGLLVSVTSTIASGREIAIMAYSPNTEEQRKAILALAIEATSMVLIDNVTGTFGSPVLDAALTATSWRDRLLGQNRIVSAPLVTVWYATGNNVVLAYETSRRCLRIRLESPLPHPEDRVGFRHPRLLDWVVEHRGRLTAAALTLLRAFSVAGRPDQGLPAWGSFEGWSDLIRNCVVWAGLADPGATRIELRSSPGSNQSALADLVAGLEDVFATLPGCCGTARDVIQALNEADDGVYPRLREALSELFPRPAGNEGLPTAHQLGAVLRTYRGRVVAERVIDHVQEERTKRGTLWCIRSAGGSPGPLKCAVGVVGAVPTSFAEKPSEKVSGEGTIRNATGGRTPAPAAPTAPGEEKWQI